MVERDENRGQLCLSSGVGTMTAALYDFVEREVTDHPGVVKRRRQHEERRFCSAKRRHSGFMTIPAHTSASGCQLARGKWRARIKLSGKKVRLGDYEYEVEAALAYDKAAMTANADWVAVKRQR